MRIANADGRNVKASDTISVTVSTKVNGGWDIIRVIWNREGRPDKVSPKHAHSDKRLMLDNIGKVLMS